MTGTEIKMQIIFLHKKQKDMVEAINRHTAVTTDKSELSKTLNGKNPYSKGERILKAAEQVLEIWRKEFNHG